MLTHIHPSPLRFARRTRLGLSSPMLNRRSVRDRFPPSPPSAQSPFAHSRCYLRWGDVSHHLRGRYPSFIAHTGSCARPNPSRCLRSLPWSAGLCRLSPVPAGKWTFPTLSLQSLPRCLDPYPAALSPCVYSFLPGRHRPHVRRKTFGAPLTPCNATSTGCFFRGCSHSLMFRLPGSLDPQVAPTAEAQCPPGGRAVYTTHLSVGYLPRAVVSLRVRHEQLTRLDSHQLDCSLVGCSSVQKQGHLATGKT